MPQTTASVTEARTDLVSHTWLRDRLDLPVSPAAHVRFVAGTGRRTNALSDRILAFYPNAYAVADDPVAHVKFALRHEPTDLTVLVADGAFR